jgi:hypothetical protein
MIGASASTASTEAQIATSRTIQRSRKMSPAMKPKPNGRVSSVIA